MELCHSLFQSFSIFKVYEQNLSVQETEFELNRISLHHRLFKLRNRNSFWMNRAISSFVVEFNFISFPHSLSTKCPDQRLRSASEWTVSSRWALGMSWTPWHPPWVHKLQRSYFDDDWRPCGENSILPRYLECWYKTPHPQVPRGLRMIPRRHCVPGVPRLWHVIRSRGTMVRIEAEKT